MGIQRQCVLLARRAALGSLLAASLSPGIKSYVCAVEPPVRTSEEILQRALYAAPAPTVASNQQQLSDAITIRSMRGVWALQEYGLDGKLIASGTIIFRGADSSPDKGQVAYVGEAAAGRGPWLLKADGFGRSKTGRGGVIEQKALFKLRRPPADGAKFAGTFTYEGRVNVPSYTGPKPDATLAGPITELINGGKPKGGSERRVGRYEAQLLRLLSDDDESTAAYDSAAAGGAPEAMQVVCLATNAAARCSR